MNESLGVSESGSDSNTSICAEASESDDSNISVG